MFTSSGLARERVLHLDSWGHVCPVFFSFSVSKAPKWQKTLHSGSGSLEWKLIDFSFPKAVDGQERWLSGKVLAVKVWERTSVWFPAPGLKKKSKHRLVCSCNSSVGKAELEGSHCLSVYSFWLNEQAQSSDRDHVSKIKVDHDWETQATFTSSLHMQLHTHAHNTYKCICIYTYSQR